MDEGINKLEHAREYLRKRRDRHRKALDRFNLVAWYSDGFNTVSTLTSVLWAEMKDEYHAPMNDEGYANKADNKTPLSQKFNSVVNEMTMIAKLRESVPFIVIVTLISFIIGSTVGQDSGLLIGLVLGAILSISLSLAYYTRKGQFVFKLISGISKPIRETITIISDELGELLGTVIGAAVTGIGALLLFVLYVAIFVGVIFLIVKLVKAAWYF